MRQCGQTDRSISLSHAAQCFATGITLIDVAIG